MRILIVEDEETLAGLIADRLKKERYTVDISKDGEDGSYNALSGIYDLILLDIMLPKKNGLEILREIREEGITSKVIMLTAKGELEDRLRGFSEGANDYLPKPFVMEELLARIRAMLRRRDSFMPAILEVGDLRLDPSDVTLHCGSKSISLQNREFQLMEALMKNPGIYQSADNLIISAWGYDVETDANAVRVYLSGLRRHLEELGSEVEIRSRRNIGYTLVWDK